MKVPASLKMMIHEEYRAPKRYIKLKQHIYEKILLKHADDETTDAVLEVFNKIIADERFHHRNLIAIEDLIKKL